MKALTLWRPWSDAIVRGPKHVENRAWLPPDAMLGRFIAIHAGRRFDDSGGCDLMAMGSGWTVPLDPKDSPEGIVGIARLVGYLDLRGCASPGPAARMTRSRVACFPGEETRPPSASFALRAQRVLHLDENRWWMGPVGWLFEEKLPIEPVPCRGAQGLWTVPSDVEVLVRARVEEARRSGPAEVRS